MVLVQKMQGEILNQDQLHPPHQTIPTEKRGKAFGLGNAQTRGTIKLAYASFLVAVSFGSVWYYQSRLNASAQTSIYSAYFSCCSSGDRPCMFSTASW